MIARKKDDENVSTKRLCENCNTELRLVFEGGIIFWSCEICETSEQIGTIKKSQ